METNPNLWLTTSEGATLFKLDYAVTRWQHGRVM